MMTVCVLVGVIDYEFSDVLGVYATRQLALEARDAYVARCEADTDFSMTDYDRYEVLPFEMNVAAAAVH